MSFHVFFDLSVGIKEPVWIPNNSIRRVVSRIAKTEETLGIERELYADNLRWNYWPLFKKEVTKQVLCRAVESHNRMVRWFHDVLTNGSKTQKKGMEEELTLEVAESFWFALKQLHVPPEKWTSEYYQARMESVYEAMRGRVCEGVMFGSESLSIEQAKEVIVMFSSWLDTTDIRLDVIKGYDHLSPSEDYEWCGNCGSAVDYEDFNDEAGMCEACFVVQPTCESGENP